MKGILNFVFVLVSYLTYGQWVAEAPLPVVSDSGYYSIPLPPEITALMGNGFNNVRIIDEAGREVPFWTGEISDRGLDAEWIDYKLQTTYKKGCCTILTWTNPEKVFLDRILIEMKVAETRKKASLVGSDDGQMWYALKDSFMLGGSTGGIKTSTHEVPFALSNYGWYRITVEDPKSAPLNIVYAGYYKLPEKKEEKYIEVPIESMTTSDSVKDHSTWITIAFDTAHYIERMDFEIIGPKFYKREAIVYQREEFQTKKGQREYLNPMHRFDIISTHQASIDWNFRKDKMYVKIMNKDNQPLQVKSVKAWQRIRHMRSWLEPGHTYKLAVGADSLKDPEYDLEYFWREFPEELDQLKPGPVKVLIKPSIATTTPTYFTNRNIIWVAIILVVVVLGTMSVRMLRENESHRKGD